MTESLLLGVAVLMSVLTFIIFLRYLIKYASKHHDLRYTMVRLKHLDHQQKQEK